MRAGTAALALVAIGVACSDGVPRARAEAGTAAPRAEPPATAPAPPTPSPAPPRVSALPVPAFGDAVVVSPRGSARAPVLVVLHGMGDGPGWICPAFVPLVAGRAWILCTRGVPLDAGSERWTYPMERRRVAAEVTAALEALARAEPNRADVGAPVLAGFSLGAMFASFLAEGDPAAFPRALVLDTHHVWSAEAVRRWTAKGGRAVAFVCTRTYARNCARLCPPEGDGTPTAPMPARCLTLADREHGYDRTFLELVRPELEAIVANDPRWAP